MKLTWTAKEIAETRLYWAQHDVMVSKRKEKLAKYINIGFFTTLFVVSIGSMFVLPLFK
jgi:hypothetical protein